MLQLILVPGAEVSGTVECSLKVERYGAGWKFLPPRDAKRLFVAFAFCGEIFEPFIVKSPWEESRALKHPVSISVDREVLRDLEMSGVKRPAEDAGTKAVKRYKPNNDSTAKSSHAAHGKRVSKYPDGKKLDWNKEERNWNRQSQNERKESFPQSMLSLLFCAKVLCINPSTTQHSPDTLLTLKLPRQILP